VNFKDFRLKELIFSNKLSALGFFTVAVFVLLALVEAVSFGRITPYNPYKPNLGQVNLAPSLNHLFGTDFEGRDIFSRAIAALPIDIGIPLAVVIMSACIGILAGVMAGYFRGWIEEVIMRVTDLFLAFPALIMVLAVAATLGPSLINAILAIVFTWWPPYVRLVRGSVLEVGTEDFIAASKTLNSSFLYILRKGIVPNVLPSVLVYATMDVGTALLDLSILGYLGIGIPPTTPELGGMVAAISNNLYTYPWEALLPAFLLFLIVAGFSFLGEGLRETLDVKVRPYILIRNKVFREAEKSIGADGGASHI
jgi:peptide/nickel transport system permease protein